MPFARRYLLNKPRHAREVQVPLTLVPPAGREPALPSQTPASREPALPSQLLGGEGPDGTGRIGLLHSASGEGGLSSIEAFLEAPGRLVLVLEQPRFEVGRIAHEAGRRVSNFADARAAG